VINIPKGQRSKIKDEFKTHLIVGTLARLRCEPLFAHTQIAAKLRKDLQSKYPKALETPGLVYQIEFAENILKNEKDSRSLALADSSKKKTVVVGSEGFLLECYDYENFDVFKADFSEVLDGIWNHELATVQPTEISLRKINNFPLEESGTKIAEFGDYFNDTLSVYFSSGNFDSQLFEDRHRLAIKENQFEVILNYGSQKGKLGETDARRFFVDIEVKTSDIEPTIKSVMSLIEQANELIFDVFVWSLKDKMIQFLKSGGE
jgi:uncharacterized protein (TIGR04255 family)